MINNVNKTVIYIRRSNRYGYVRTNSGGAFRSVEAKNDHTGRIGKENRGKSIDDFPLYHRAEYACLGHFFTHLHRARFGRQRNTLRGKSKLLNVPCIKRQSSEIRAAVFFFAHLRHIVLFTVFRCGDAFLRCCRSCFCWD